MWHCGFTAIKAQVQKAIKSYLAAAQTFYTDLIHMTKKRLPKHWIKFNRPDGRRTVWRCQKQKKTFRNLVERKIPILYILVFSDRKSTRLNSSHVSISYAVFC